MCSECERSSSLCVLTNDRFCTLFTLVKFWSCALISILRILEHFCTNKQRDHGIVELHFSVLCIFLSSQNHGIFKDSLVCSNQKDLTVTCSFVGNADLCGSVVGKQCPGQPPFPPPPPLTPPPPASLNGQQGM